jgi:ribonuclease D
VKYLYVDSPEDLQAVCRAMQSARLVAWDTEFVAEDVYRPDLCLIQINIDGQLFLIDPKKVEDLGPFWEQLVEGPHETVVHAGREELRFCWGATRRFPRKWTDIQLVAGLIGHEYPAAYHKLISKVLGQTVPKGETRTDWRRRPLAERQLEYALQDVVYLIDLRDSLHKELEALGRVDWLADETQSRQEEILHEDQSERWRRISGISSVPDRSLVIARELWRWRERLAEEQDRPAKWILRDDLLVELARRASDDPQRIRLVRGMERRQLRSQILEIAQVIQRARQMPQSDGPRSRSVELPHQIQSLAQFLSTAVASICRAQRLAPSLVGTVQDLRELIAYRLKLVPMTQPPALTEGWRAQVIGHSVQRLLDGQLAIRIDDPLSEHPIVLEEVRAGDPPG